MGSHHASTARSTRVSSLATSFDKSPHRDAGWRHEYPGCGRAPLLPSAGATARLTGFYFGSRPHLGAPLQTSFRRGHDPASVESGVVLQRRFPRTARGAICVGSCPCPLARPAWARPTRRTGGLPYRRHFSEPQGLMLTANVPIPRTERAHAFRCWIIETECHALQLRSQGHPA